MTAGHESGWETRDTGRATGEGAPGGVRLAYVTTIPLTQWAFLRGQNRYMAERGMELHAVAAPGPLLDRLVERDGVVPHPLPISRGAITPILDLVSLLRLVALLRRIRPHILHVSTPKAALIGAVAGWLTGVPTRLFLFRGSATEGTTGIRRRLFTALERLTAALCHQTVCVAPSLRSFARSAGILGPEDGVVLASGMSNGIDLSRFDPAALTPEEAARRLGGLLPPRWLQDADCVIGYLGRVAHDKGIGELAAAWERVRDDHPGLRLLIVGPWERTSAVPAALRERLERDPRVAITGAVEDVPACYRLMDLFVYPSHGTEGFPNAPMEAAAMGLPVIATRVVGSVDAVQDDRTGTLIDVQNVDQLVAAIRGYQRDPGLREEQGRRGRERVEDRFRQELIWEAIYTEYRRLLHGHRLRAPDPDHAGV